MIKGTKSGSVGSLLDNGRSCRIAYAVLSLLCFGAAIHFLIPARRAMLDFLSMITTRELGLVFMFAFRAGVAIGLLAFGLVFLLAGVSTSHTDKAIRIFDERLTALEDAQNTEKSAPGAAPNGGSAPPAGSSRVAEGPPSVS